MKTSTAPKKIFTQKGQGLIEYALLFGFVAAVALIVFVKGGFGQSMSNTYDVAGANIAAAGDGLFDSNDAEISTDPETMTVDDIVAPTYKTLNWQQIIMGVPSMYGTVMGSDTADKALVSETNLFGQVSAMVDGHLASTKAEDGTKDWETMMKNMESMQARTGFTSSYVRGEESITISRLGNSNAVQIRYTDGKEVVYYRLSPDANNVMQIETNSNKSYSQFFSPIVNSGGWSYAK